MRYLALTIGPINKTLSLARKTRELWAASYLFSYLMKQIILNLTKDGIQEEQFILPWAGKEAFQSPQGTGLFPDRCIIKAWNDKDFLSLKKAIGEAMTTLATGFEKLPVYLHLDHAVLRSEIEHYFRTYAIEIEAIEGENPLVKINECLSALELQQSIHSPLDDSLIENLLDKATVSFLGPDAFEGKTRIEFKTIPEYTTSALRSDHPERYAEALANLDPEDDDKLMKALQEKFEDIFYSYHKYICIVRADGDNLGEILCHFKGDISELSKRLFHFGQSAVKLIRDYQGEPIFAGGDDLMFWAPVAIPDTNIFDLIFQLHGEFEKIVNEDNIFEVVVDNNKLRPTLSFGLSITYYKFPLYEALILSDKELINAKYLKDGWPKNSLSWIFQKHSGSGFQQTIRFDSPVFFGDKPAFLHLLNHSLQDKQFLSSIATKARDNFELLDLFTKITDDLFLKKRVTALFNLHFDRENKDDQKDFLDRTEELFMDILKDPLIANKGEAFFNVLRTIKFVKGLEDEH